MSDSQSTAADERLAALEAQLQALAANNASLQAELATAKASMPQKALQGLRFEKRYVSKGDLGFSFKISGGGYWDVSISSISSLRDVIAVADSGALDRALADAVALAEGKSTTEIRDRVNADLEASAKLKHKKACRKEEKAAKAAQREPRLPAYEAPELF